MTRKVGAVAIALALLADTATAVGQVRIRRDDGQPAPVGRIGEWPSTRSTVIRTETTERPADVRSRATLTFVPGPLDVGRFPVLFLWPVGLGWASFGYVPLRPWNDITPMPSVPAALGPLPDGAPIGGVQLDIEPRRAQVYVDGTHVGLVSDFSGYYQHLDLVAGLHLITILAPNYEPLIIHVVVSPGHTTTYRGTLTRANGR